MAVEPAGPVESAIRALLAAHGVAVRTLEHPAVRTAEEAAAARGTPLSMGAKAIVLKTDDAFRLLALPADRALRARRIRRALGVRRTRFATADELRTLTGLAPGAVPPFGEPVLPLELVADPGLVALDSLAFTPGTPRRSFLIAAADWVRVARPRLAEIAE